MTPRALVLPHHRGDRELVALEEALAARKSTGQPLARETLLALIYQYPFIRSYADRIYGCEPLLVDQGHIVGPCDAHGYDNEWMYASFDEAILALLAWDGEDEPQGWMRHMPSGRR